jgi:hypothetical protein
MRRAAPRARQSLSRTFDPETWSNSDRVAAVGITCRPPGRLMISGPRSPNRIGPGGVEPVPPAKPNKLRTADADRLADAAGDVADRGEQRTEP